ncbi:hypothetical protein ANCCAN_18382 [Ancylostoma caninum]|uniref:Uncharacterized protein n=1 Tax=Ancylostoma caninum TaxID=29170 RepID=A0A368FW70_ANCCA|nr:hypothetical protein ANCCAN_18382 [Ancylostoma caninum]
MKLLPGGIKPECTLEKEKEMVYEAMNDDEKSLVSSVLPEEKPKSSSSKITGVAGNIVNTLIEKKKETCVLLPKNCCLLSNHCCVSKLPGVRQLKEKLVPKEANA